MAPVSTRSLFVCFHVLRDSTISFSLIIIVKLSENHFLSFFLIILLFWHNCLQKRKLIAHLLIYRSTMVLTILTGAFLARNKFLLKRCSEFDEWLQNKIVSFTIFIITSPKIRLLRYGKTGMCWLFARLASLDNVTEAWVLLLQNSV